MKKLSDFFDKFNNSAFKEIKKREIIVNIIKNTTNADIKIEDINIKNGNVYINSNQFLKSEIFIKKQTILELISKEIKGVSDIK